MKQSRNGNHGACQLKRQGVGASSEEGRGWWDAIVFDREGDECTSVPCCIKEPTPNQKLLRRVKLFSTTSDPGLQGWASYHSYGLNLGTRSGWNHQHLYTIWETASTLSYLSPKTQNTVYSSDPFVIVGGLPCWYRQRFWDSSMHHLTEPVWPRGKAVFIPMQNAHNGRWTEKGVCLCNLNVIYHIHGDNGTHFHFRRWVGWLTGIMFVIIGVNSTHFQGAPTEWDSSRDVTSHQHNWMKGAWLVDC